MKGLRGPSTWRLLGGQGGWPGCPGEEQDKQGQGLRSAANSFFLSAGNSSPGQYLLP